MNRPPAHPTGRRLTLTGIVSTYVRLFTESRGWLLVATGAFVACLVAGMVGASLNPTAHNTYLRDAFLGLQPTLEALRQGNDLRAITTIYLRNLSITLFVLGTGALVWPLLMPILLVGANAYLLGVVIILGNQDPSRLVRAVLPHAIFELPALVIASAWSLKMAIGWLMPKATGRRGEVWNRNVFEMIWIIPLLAVMLAVAASIEVLVSARLSGVLGAS